MLPPWNPSLADGCVTMTSGRYDIHSLIPFTGPEASHSGARVVAATVLESREAQTAGK